MPTKREEIFRLRKELIELSAAEAKAHGRKCPVILVLDLSDKFAKEMAISVAGSEEVDRRVKHGQSENADSILIVDYELEDAVQSFANATPNGAANIQAIAASGQVPVAIFADGGVSWTGIWPPV